MPDQVPSQSYARNQLGITDKYKSDVSYVAEIEVVKKVPILDGVAGPQPPNAFNGGGSQMMIDVPKGQTGDYFKIVRVRPLPKE